MADKQRNRKAATAAWSAVQAYTAGGAPWQWLVLDWNQIYARQLRRY